MNKIIYITEDKLKILKESNEIEEVTFYSFFNKIKDFIKQLLHDPINAEIDKIFKLNGIGKTTLLKKMINRNIIEKKQKIEEVDGSARYYIQYKVPKKNFELKLRRLYTELFEKNINEKIDKYIDSIDDISNGGLNPYENYTIDDILKNKNLNENAMSEDGASSCAGVGAIGDGSDSSGQYTKPLFGMMHRSFWNAGNIQPTMKRIGNNKHKKHKKKKKNANL